MAQDAMRKLFVQGLQALHTSGEEGSKSAAANLAAASSPELKEALQDGSELAKRHAERIQQLFQMVGTQPGSTDNPILRGIQAVNERILDASDDAQTRDAGIIATGQIALHYHIAAFGTLGAHAKALNLTEAAGLLHQMVEDCKRMDERYTKIAERVVNPQAAA